LRRLAFKLPRRRQPFTSARAAQVWFEWRRTGKSLPVMTLFVLPMVLLPLLLGKNDVIPTARTLLMAMGVPVLLAGIAGTTVSGKNPWVKDYYGVAPFTATVPMTSAAMVAAKLKAALWSTLVAWAVVVVTTSVAVVLTGNLDEVADWWRQAVQQHDLVKVVVGIVAVVALLVVWTWKHLVDSLLLGLTGRKWVIQGAIIVGMIGFLALWAFGAWIYRHPETHDTFLAALPWLLGLLVLCRLLATGWALRRLLRDGLLETQTALRCIGTWLLLAATLFGVLICILPLEQVPVYYLAFGVVSVFPMARLAATPLALAWNRHR
jgi:hypothetical protein